MSGPRILIAGASIAGPALAHWLARYGAQVTVVERRRACGWAGRPSTRAPWPGT